MQFAGVLADCTLAETGTTAELLQRALVAQLAHSERLTDVQLPEPDEPSARHALPDGEPRIVLNDGVVSYNDRPILHHLSWRVNPGEHWQIVGPNGAGKSTLLSLITGDHPQGYSNDLTLFGRRRGSGETIWDIKTYRLRQQQFTSGLPRQYHGTQCHSLRLFRFYRHLPGRFRQATKTGATVAGYSGNR